MIFISGNEKGQKTMMKNGKAKGDQKTLQELREGAGP